MGELRHNERSCGKHRKCQDVLAGDISRDALELQQGYILAHERTAPGHQPCAPLAQERQRVASGVRSPEATRGRHQKRAWDWNLDIPHESHTSLLCGTSIFA